MSWYTIYALCNRHNWFNAGTCEQYERLRKMVRAGATMREIALVIWICTTEDSGETIESISEKLKEATEG